jgi:two-component system, NarL family, nitrate/nitrite response regulator NarL
VETSTIRAYCCPLMRRSPSIRVYVADVHRIARYGVVRALEASGRFSVVGQTDEGDQVVADVIRLAPDVAVLAEQLGPVSALELLTELPPGGPTRAVLLSTRLDHTGVYAALAAGATGYLTARSTDAAQLCETVAAAASDELALDADAQRALATQIHAGHDHYRPTLTAREREVIRLAADGFQTGQIAHKLNVGVTTVKKHQQSAYEKLGVGTSAGTLAKALRLALIS